MSPDTDAPFLPDSEFDLRARAELAIAFEASDAPAHLYRKPQPLLATGEKVEDGGKKLKTASQPVATETVMVRT